MLVIYTGYFHNKRVAGTYHIRREFDVKGKDRGSR